MAWPQRTWPDVVGFERGQEEQANKSEWPLEAGKSKDMYSPLETPEGT